MVVIKSNLTHPLFGDKLKKKEKVRQLVAIDSNVEAKVSVSGHSVKVGDL